MKGESEGGEEGCQGINDGSAEVRNMMGRGESGGGRGRRAEE